MCPDWGFTLPWRGAPFYRHSFSAAYIAPRNPSLGEDWEKRVPSSELH
jgi:hypothetical protein